MLHRSTLPQGHLSRITLHMRVPLVVINDEVICGFVNEGKRSLGAVQGLSRSGRIMGPEV